MGKYMRPRETILAGSSDNDMDLSDLCQFLARDLMKELKEAITYLPETISPRLLIFNLEAAKQNPIR